MCDENEESIKEAKNIKNLWWNEKYTFWKYFTFIFTFVKQNKEEKKWIAISSVKTHTLYALTGTLSVCVCLNLFISAMFMMWKKNQQIHYYAHELCKSPFKCAKWLFFLGETWQIVLVGEYCEPNIYAGATHTYKQTVRYLNSELTAEGEITCVNNFFFRRSYHLPSSFLASSHLPMYSRAHYNSNGQTKRCAHQAQVSFGFRRRRKKNVKRISENPQNLRKQIALTWVKWLRNSLKNRQKTHAENALRENFVGIGKRQWPLKQLTFE